MVTRTGALAACALLVAAAPLPAQTTGAPALGIRILPPDARWSEAWRPLLPAADLPRPYPAPPGLPDLLTSPAPRAGLLWTAGVPAGLPFEVDTSVSRFSISRARESGSYRRPLDPAVAGGTVASGQGWRRLGRSGAVIGRVVVADQALDPGSSSPGVAPYGGSSPLVPTDTTTPGAGIARAVLEAGGGWRLGGWAAGLALGYETLDNRSRRTRLPRIGRAVNSGGVASLARAFGGARAALYGRWSMRTETFSVISRSFTGEAHELTGYAEPEPIPIVPGNPIYRRRMSTEGTALGAAGAGRLGRVSWALFGERTELEQLQSSRQSNDPPQDRWAASGSRFGGAAAAPLGGRALVTLELHAARLTGAATVANLPGVIFRLEDRLVSAAGEARLAPPPAGGWGAAARVTVQKRDRRARDILALTSSALELWEPGGAVEIARALTPEWLIGAGYAASLYAPSAELPTAPTNGPVYERLVAPEVGFQATRALSHAASLTARWRITTFSDVIAQVRYASTSPDGPAADAAPGGRRSAWALLLGVGTRQAAPVSAAAAAAGTAR